MSRCNSIAAQRAGSAEDLARCRRESRAGVLSHSHSERLAGCTHTEHSAWMSQSLPSPDFMCFFEQKHKFFGAGVGFWQFLVNSGHQETASPCRKKSRGL